MAFDPHLPHLPEHLPEKGREAVERVSRLLPQRVWRILFWLILAVQLLFVTVYVGLRFWVLPHIGDYKDDVARLLSESLHLKVEIASIDADWHGLHPHLGLSGLKIFDQAGRPALGFDRVDTELAWSSIPLWQLRLKRLEIDAPQLAIRRDQSGQLFVAGLPLTGGGEDGGFSDWLLVQRSILIRDAGLSWSDELRGAPTLALQKVQISLDNVGSRHRLKVTAEPPRELASPIELQADFRGEHLNQPEQWRGEAIVQMGYADLAGWKAWVDYPLELPRGAGSLKLWLDISKGQPVAVTAELGLANVHLRLSPKLPMLDLISLAGRLRLARSEGEGFEFSAWHLGLNTRDGIQFMPADFTVRYQPGQAANAANAAGAGSAGAGKPYKGEVTAGQVDLEALNGLAAFLPLEAGLRTKLAEFAPKGRISGLRLAWEGRDEQLLSYGFQAGFTGLGLRPVAAIPGFSGLSGRVEGTQRGGSLTLSGRHAALELPDVFAESHLPLDEVKAAADWSQEGDALEVHIQNIAFTNRDAAGSAVGSYRRAGTGPGSIDLTAALSRGDGTAVWRYMPHAVNKDVPLWLKAAIQSGKSDDTRLVLKGNLADFPFADGKSGIFRVSGRFTGARLRYAPDWPEIKDITGSLLFEGKRMLIQASKGNILGVSLSEVSAGIPDLDDRNPVLKVTGIATGASPDFLRFIDQSPVARYIDRFTDGMSAKGNGTLHLSLNLPLQHIVDSTVAGEYQFSNNTLNVDASLPPLTEASGRLDFTDRGLNLRQGTAKLLGSPLTVSVSSGKEGAVQVNAQGSMTVAALRKLADHPLFDHLSGSAAWQGQLSVRKKNVDLVLDSNLQGISSSLPEPLNKSVNDSLPLHLERTLLPETTADGGSRDRVKLSLGQGLGKGLALALQRRHHGDKTTVEKGAIVLRDAAAVDIPPLPDSGLSLNVALKFLNIEFWQKLLADNGAAPPRPGAAPAAPAFPINLVVLRCGELLASGRRFADVSLRAHLQEGVWRAQVSSGDISGELAWNGRDRGRLQAHLKQLTLGESKADAKADSKAGGVSVDEPPSELPALDLIVDSFTLRGMALGRLELVAENHGAVWTLPKVSLNNADGSLLADGQWRLPVKGGSGASGEIQLNFKLETAAIAKLLERMGYPNTMRRGSGKLEGKVSWNGGPTRVDFASLSGTVAVDAQKGQFTKLADPGVGRLLGILSLQSLPRRITLDFRDIFSEGFAFDSITGDLNLHKGLVSTKNLLMVGPAARVQLQGDANLIRESQNLVVRIQPAVGETLSVGTMLIHPAVGLATYVAQKILKDPLGQMLAFEYSVTGSWSDPKVEKISAKSAKGGEK